MMMRTPMEVLCLWPEAGSPEDAVTRISVYLLVPGKILWGHCDQDISVFAYLCIAPHISRCFTNTMEFWFVINNILRKPPLWLFCSMDGWYQSSSEDPIRRFGIHRMKDYFFLSKIWKYKQFQHFQWLTTSVTTFMSLSPLSVFSLRFHSWSVVFAWPSWLFLGIGPLCTFHQRQQLLMPCRSGKIQPIHFSHFLNLVVLMLF